MTTRTLLFDSPFLLGFDQTRALIDRAAKAAAEGYPPYNVEDRGPDGVRISLAVAGFTPDDLTVTLEGRQLTIAGKREDAGKTDNAYLHRGIAARGFVRSYVLADGLEVTGAALEHGLLHVDLKRPERAETIKRIPITSG
ncbi:Hsp20 family protein [Brevundimonas sp. BAL450]|jgi:HSP20 family molecular chaperone IbpA|uniref:Small heat shock protein n=1 Tax=Brevundimonas abyssalis TAR-001 TaxID=1391729 RepID=A0A8E0KID8_9CAUL|nr:MULTISPECIES: Hsp20 family protein [Brevundimonas]MBG7616546.1 Hsp20 family protein [Brevundimonas sp. BAL450]GAD57815.1 small heat shock protein [Brevundimonas abyssalis TAR-001]